ncbi:MAG: O-antigen ligase family protein [Acidimicrobiia bacterium]|nr:O-antigen ligase family protein [Acidimicrobiia bacterium]
MLQSNPQVLGRSARTTRRNNLVLGLISLYVVLLPFPVLVELAGGGAILTGPSDVVLAILIIVAVGGAVIVPRAWSRWHFALLLLPVVSGVGVGLLGHRLSLSVVLAKVFGMVALFLLYLLLTSYVRSWADLRNLAKLFVNVVIWLNLAATVLFVTGINVPFVNTEPQRLSGLNPDPNAYGGLLLVALALAVPTLRSEEPLVTGRFGRIAVLVLPLSILLTSSRSAWIGFVAILLVLIVLRPRVWLRYVIVSSVLLLIVGLLIAPDLATDQIALANRGNSSRFIILEQTSDVFWSSPIVGIGLGQFAERYGIIIHSTGGWFLGEFGLIGFTILAGFMITFLRWGWAAYKVQPEPNRSLVLGTLAAFVAMAALSLGIEALYQRWWWLTMAFLGSMRAVGVELPDGDSTGA